MNQTEALRLAKILETEATHSIALDLEAAAELRRLHALNAELLEAVKRLSDWAEQTRASGDAGSWDWSEGDEYMQARAVIAKAENKHD